MERAFSSGARRVEMVGRHLKDCMARSQHKSLRHRREGAGETDILRTVEQNESQI